jgi:hypothetical protein
VKGALRNVREVVADHPHHFRRDQLYDRWDYLPLDDEESPALCATPSRH